MHSAGKNAAFAEKEKTFHREILTHGTVVYTDASATFGEDALLLARFCGVRPREAVCELGTGCGAVALCWHDEGHRGPCAALELNPDALSLLRAACRDQNISHIVPLWADLRSVRLAPARRTEERRSRTGTDCEKSEEKFCGKSIAALGEMSQSCAQAPSELFEAPNLCTEAPSEVFEASNPCAQAPSGLFEASNPCAQAPSGLFEAPNLCAETPSELFEALNLCTQVPGGPFEVVACNPPYFSTGRRSSNRARALARHEESCTLADVCGAARRLLKDGGRLCVCQRPERLAELFEVMRTAGFTPHRLQFAAACAQAAPWLCLVEARKNRACALQVLPLFVRSQSEPQSER